MKRSSSLFLLRTSQSSSKKWPSSQSKRKHRSNRNFSKRSASSSYPMSSMFFQTKLPSYQSLWRELWVSLALTTDSFATPSLMLDSSCSSAFLSSRRISYSWRSNLKQRDSTKLSLNKMIASPLNKFRLSHKPMSLWEQLHRCSRLESSTREPKMSRT